MAVSDYLGINKLSGLYQYVSDTGKKTVSEIAPTPEQLLGYGTKLTNETSTIVDKFNTSHSVNSDGIIDPYSFGNSNADIVPSFSTTGKNLLNPDSSIFGAKPGVTDGTLVPRIDLLAGATANIQSSVNPPAKNEFKYDFTNYSYPADLFDSSKKYGDAYIAFYINVQEDSKLARTQPNQIVNDSEVTKGKGSAITKSKVSGAELVGVTTGIGVISGTIVGQALGVGGGISGGALGAIIGAGQVTAKSGVFTENQYTPEFNVKNLANINVTRQTKRIKTAIALYTPNDLSFKYGANWGSDNTAVLQAGLAVGGDLEAAIRGKPKGAANSVNAITGLVLSAAQAAAPGGLSALTGTAPNPKKEQTFEGVDFRTHQFQFRFWIRNTTESNNIARIIKEFKYHMHPEYKDDNDFIFLYPSEFDIKFYNNGKESTELPKVTSCVLTDLSTNYTPNGVMNLLKDGKIPEITINLIFRELAILTKSDILLGY